MVGGINTAFGLALFALLILLNHWLHVCSSEVERWVVPLITLVCGVLFNFKTYGTLVFRNRNNWLIFRFFAVYLFTYLVTVGLLKLFDHYGIGSLPAMAIIVLPVNLCTFVLQKRLVFRSLEKA